MRRERGGEEQITVLLIHVFFCQSLLTWDGSGIDLRLFGSADLCRDLPPNFVCHIVQYASRMSLIALLKIFGSVLSY